MGNIYTRIFDTINRSVLDRREKTHGNVRLRKDHPEFDPPEKTLEKTISIAEQQAEKSTDKCSDFYMACRDNRVEDVQKMLENLTQDEIDRIEPNGSTALHAAAYHGHAGIVRILLDRGADRAIENKFKCLPFDEAANDQIKELFLRIPNSNRLITNTGNIEWELISEDALDKACEERSILETVYKKNSIEKMFEKIQVNYIESGLANVEKISQIKHFFEKATRNKDPTWIVKAYTAETDFFNVLNAETAGGASKYQSERRYIIALLMFHPILNQYSFTGISYRVMQINQHDLSRYQINRLSMTKSFLSSSIQEEIAAWFLTRQQASQMDSLPRTRHKTDGSKTKIWIMCIYQIRHPRTALHIENISQYTTEGEILIMPFTVFRVKQIKKVVTSYIPEGELITQIHFEEIDEYAND